MYITIETERRNKIILNFRIHFPQNYGSQKINATDNSALIHYIRDLRTVYPAVEWRITIHGKVLKPDGSGASSIVHVSLGLIVAAVLLNLFN